MPQKFGVVLGTLIFMLGCFLTVCFIFPDIKEVFFPAMELLTLLIIGVVCDALGIYALLKSLVK